MSTRTKFRWTSPARRLPAAALVSLATAIALPAQQHQVAPGWFGVTAIPSEYRMGIEPMRRPGSTGFVGATIEGLERSPYATGFLLQSIRADQFRARRVRLTGWLKTVGDSMDAQARLWMRVDGAAGPQSSDYMIDRPVLGSCEWAPYAVVLDVPRDAIGISFGVALTGRGQMWLDDVTLEIVGTDVATTGQPGVAIYPAGRAGMGELWRWSPRAYTLAPSRPINLGFEESLVVATR